MKKKLLIPVIIIIQIIIVVVCIVSVAKKESVQLHFGIQDYVFDAGVVSDEGIYVDKEYAEGLSGIYTVPVVLPEGNYQITFCYEAEDSHCTYEFIENGYPYYAFEYDRGLTLQTNNNEQTAFLKTATDAENFQIKILYDGQGSLLLKDIELTSVKEASYFEVLHLVLFFVILDLFLWILYQKYYKKNIESNGKSMFLPVFVIGLLASLPLFSDYLIQGHDLSFHLLRIEGIKEALLSGQFPVRIHPVQFEGYGYATGVYYPELFLYLPALMRLLNFRVMDAYKFFLFLLNMTTAGISYFSFKKMCNSPKAGLCGSALYTLSLYRMINVYYRSALGESIAMAFIPLVFLGIYEILVSNKEDRVIRRQGMLSLTVGLTGILQSHILSCEMIGIVCAFLAVIYLKKIMKQGRWLNLITCGAFTLLLNLWFLVPFLMSMRENIMVKASAGDIAGQALNPVQIFFPLADVTGSNENLLNGMAAEMPFGIGFAVTMSILIIALGIHNWYKKDAKMRCGFGVVCFGLGFVTLWMTTTWFPWLQIDEIGGLFAKVLNMVQYPWRYIGLATILFVMAILFYIKDTEDEKVKNGIGIVLMTIAVFSSCMFAQKLYQNDNVYRVYQEEGVKNLTFGATEYLYNGTKTENIISTDELVEMQPIITSFEKSGTNMVLSVNNNSEDAQICYLPVFYYPSYVAYDTNSKEMIALERAVNSNNVIQLMIPAGYQGDICIDVKDPVLWQVTNWISLISVLGMIFFFRKKKIKH